MLPFGKLQMETLKCVIAQLSLACIVGSLVNFVGIWSCCLILLNKHVKYDPPPIKGMFHCGTCSGWRWWPGAEVCLVFLLFLCGWSGDAAASLLPSRAFGLGEGLLVGMLLGMHLLVHEITGQLIPIVNLQLGNRQKAMSRWTAQSTSTHTFRATCVILVPQVPPFWIPAC